MWGQGCHRARWSGAALGRYGLHHEAAQLSKLPPMKIQTFPVPQGCGGPRGSSRRVTCSIRQIMIKSVQGDAQTESNVSSSQQLPEKKTPLHQSWAPGLIPSQVL